MQRNFANANYAFNAPSVSRSYTANGLNRYTSVGGATFTYDGRGNLTSDGSRNFTYDFENHLMAVSGSASLALHCDPLGRLTRTARASMNRWSGMKAPA